MNWCWTDELNISKLVKRYKEFIPDKWLSLFVKIEEKCNEHDNDYDKWWNYIDKIKADYKFALSVIHLLHWTTTINRIVAFSLIMTILRIKGNSSFTFKK